MNINRNRLKSEKNQGSQTVKGTDQKLKKRNEADLALRSIELLAGKIGWVGRMSSDSLVKRDASDCLSGNLTRLNSNKRVK